MIHHKNDIKKIYYKNNEITKAYYGNNLVYRASENLDLSINYTNFPINPNSINWYDGNLVSSSLNTQNTIYSIDNRIFFNGNYNLTALLNQITMGGVRIPINTKKYNKLKIKLSNIKLNQNTLQYTRSCVQITILNNRDYTTQPFFPNIKQTIYWFTTLNINEYNIELDISNIKETIGQLVISFGSAQGQTNKGTGTIEFTIDSVNLSM